MILASKRPLWTCITDSRQTSHYVQEVPHFRTHAPQQTAPLLDHLVGESYETWRTSRPETEAPKYLQRFDDDVQGLRQKRGSQYCHQAVNGYV
jgi:hypothetical protein